MDNEAFFKMPKVLFTDKYKSLSAEAKLLYGLMLDRMHLSAINGWCDINGVVFIFVSVGDKYWCVELTLLFIFYECP